MQMLPRENSALDFHANAMSVAQCKGCRGTCDQICHWKEESRGKGTWKSSTPMTGGLAAALHIIQKP